MSFPASTSRPLLSDTPDGFLGFLLQSLVAMANDSTNTKYFLPNFLATIKLSNGQSIVPYTTSVNLGELTGMQQEASSTVCSFWAAANNYAGGTATAPPDVDITSATFNGLNNACILEPVQLLAPTPDLAYPVVFTTALNAYQGGAYVNLGISPASFSFSVPCQATSNSQPETDTVQATGTFTGSFTEPQFTLVLLFTFADDLTLRVAIPASYALPDGTSLPGLQLTFGTGGTLAINNVTITSAIDPGLEQQVVNLLNEALGAAETIQTIVDNFNTTINEADTRASIAAAFSTQFNSLINSLK